MFPQIMYQVVPYARDFTYQVVLTTVSLKKKPLPTATAECTVNR